jgi:hypothetical protein
MVATGTLIFSTEFLKRVHKEFPVMWQAKMLNAVCFGIFGDSEGSG